MFLQRKPTFEMGITVWTFRHVAKRLIETSLVAQRPGQSPPKLEVKNLRVDVNDDAAMLIETVKLPVKDSHVNFGFGKRFWWNSDSHKIMSPVINYCL